jgi:hypothetical protein
MPENNLVDYKLSSISNKNIGQQHVRYKKSIAIMGQPQNRLETGSKNWFIVSATQNYLRFKPPYVETEA